MAEIKIQEKKSPVWPWILGIILIALAVWLILENRNDDDDNSETALADDTTYVDSAEMYDEAQINSEEEVNNFTGFVQSNDTVTNIDENYVRTGFERLLSAVSAVISDQNINDTDIAEQRDSLTNYVDDLNSGEIEENRENVRKAFVSASDLMQAVQRKNFPDLKSRVDEIKQTAQSMRGKKLNQQKEKVKEYFEKSSMVLQEMVNKEI